MQVLSSLSGITFYAPSAGFAPTNSADVSAIASAYQVVSATGTQLYAGTAYLTSVNEVPVSASRAGNAANATLATSAYYDGTGRLISALPDSAAVSAIASSYVESGVSSKQDTLSFAYNTADQISSINGSALGGMDEAAVSGIASAYAESAASSKADTSALSGYYTTANESGFLTAQVQASWSESASASPSYIQDKPDLVDIVAGPGIHIDNPDGNTLRVSMAQDYETVLYSGNITASNGTGALAYPPSAFSDLKVEWYGENTGEYGLKCSYFHNDGLNFSGLACGGIGEVYDNYAMGHHFGYLTLTNDTVTLVRQCRYNLTTTGLGAFEAGNGMFRVQRIIGINRTASAQ